MLRDSKSSTKAMMQAHVERFTGKDLLGNPKEQAATATTTTSGIIDNNPDHCPRITLVANRLASKRRIITHLDEDELSGHARDLRTALCESMVKRRGGDVFDDDDENEALWRPFYTAMCQEAIRRSKKTKKDVVLISLHYFEILVVFRDEI